MLVGDIAHVRVVGERGMREGPHSVAEDEREGYGDVVVGGLVVRLLLSLARSAGATGGMSARKVDTLTASTSRKCLSLWPRCAPAADATGPHHRGRAW